MSEQARILAEIYELIMNILKNGTPTIEDGDKIEVLEELLHKQMCFQKSDNAEHEYQGEEVASLFFTNNYTQAVEKMIACKITPDDFFGFIEYHYDDEHPDEELTVMFTKVFRKEVQVSYGENINK